MKNKYLFPVLIVLTAVSCIKSKTIVNNYTTPTSNAQPAFVINGITDLSFTNNFNVNGGFGLSIEHKDSAQENVNLSLSGLPTGVILDTSWVHSGIPTYTTSLMLFDTAITGGATPGTYPLTLTAATASGNQKNFVFNMTIHPMPTTFFGKYNNCHLYCSGTTDYTDSVYADATVVNKIWFANYANSGHSVYGMLTGHGGAIIIPSQTIGGITYTGSGGVDLPHYINISITSSCAINMFQ